jgi:hypothetical protein
MPVAEALRGPQIRQARGDFALEAARQELQRKEEIIRQVCRGQLPLLEAASRFREAMRAAEWGGWSGAGRAEAQDAEACCRTVIAWVGLALADRPELAVVVTGRLEAELELNLARFGRVQFPSSD